MVSQSIIKTNKGSLYNISYMDNSGKVSERRIKVLSVYTSSYGKKYIRAWCYLRNEERTFRADRIICILQAEELEKAIYREPAKKAETAVPVNSFSIDGSISLL